MVDPREAYWVEFEYLDTARAYALEVTFEQRLVVGVVAESVEHLLAVVVSVTAALVQAEQLELGFDPVFEHVGDDPDDKEGEGELFEKQPFPCE